MNMHFLWYGKCLDHGTVWGKVAVQDGHPAVHGEWVRARPDDLVLVDLEVVQVTTPFGKEERVVLDFLEVLAERLARDGQAVQMEQVSQLEHDSRNAARVPEVLDRIPAGRLDVGQHRDPPVDAVEVVDGDLDARLPGDRRDVQQRVGGPAHGGVQNDGVLERFTSQDGAWPEVLLDQRDELLAGGAGVAQELGQWRWDERGSGEREPERLGQHLPGACASHELAGSAGRTRPALGTLEILPRQFATFDGRSHLPHLVRRHVVGGVQLSATGQVDGRQVAARDGEQVRGHRLVIAGDQDHAVVRLPERVHLDHGRHDVAGDKRVAHAVGGLDDTVADVADGKDAGLPARLVHPVADLLDQLPEVKRPRVAHAIGAVHQDLRFGEIFLGPVHP